MAPTFRQLQYFTVLADELNFGRAANRLNISQPPLSAAIRQLEEDLGVRLFDRDSKRVILTPAGRAFRGRAQRLLAYLDETLSITRRAASDDVASLRIGFVSSMIYRRLPEFLREFEERHPSARVMLNEMHSAEQFDALLRGQIDIGFIHGLPLPQGIESMLLMREPFVCCVPAKHRLAHAPFVTLSQLAQERLIIFSRSFAPDYHDRIFDILGGMQLELQITHTGSHWLTVVALVSAGAGISLVPQSLAHSRFSDVVFLPLDRDYGHHDACCVWATSVDNNARDLMLKVVRDVLNTSSST